MSVPPLNLKALTDSELASLAAPKWLVKDFIGQGDYGVFYGGSGSFKSFGVLDLLLSIATGQDWHGHRVCQQRVLYVVAEGQGGLPKRVAAWKAVHGINAAIEGAFFCFQPIDLMKDRDVRALIDLANQHHASVIVIDTLARCFSGDENAANDLHVVNAAVGRLQDGEENKRTVILVHHTTKSRNKDGKDIISRTERGSGALRGAADTMILVERSKKDDSVTLTTSKQKDNDDDVRLRLRFKTVALGTNDEGDPVTSGVLVDSGLPKNDPAMGGVSPHLLEMAALLRDGPLSWADWRAAWMKKTGKSDSAFSRQRNALVDRGMVETGASGSDKNYSLTIEGRALVEGAPPQLSLSSTCH